MGEYDSKLDERGKLFPAPKHHRVNMDGYLRSYLYNPALYLLSVARARLMVEAHCGPEEPQEVTLKKSCGGKEATNKTNTQKVKTDIWATMTGKYNRMVKDDFFNNIVSVWCKEDLETLNSIVIYSCLSCWPCSPY